MKRKIKNIVVACIAVAVVGVLALCLLAASGFRSRRSLVTTDGTTESDGSARSMNILFLGTDREAALCDVILLANLDFEAERVTVAQIPRDTYAAYTSQTYKKLNGAYSSLGGAAETADFLAKAMGIDIRHYVCIDLDTLGAVVDALGGVDIDIPCDMVYSDSEQGLYIDLKKGTAHLDGELAEQFLRFRSGYINGDIGRMDAQKLFLAALMNTVAQKLSPVVAMRLSAAAEGVETDLSVADMLSIGIRLLDVKGEAAVLLTLPGEEAVASVSGASYYVVSRSACEEIMKKYFGASAPFDADGSFLNTNYESFESIYSSYREYTPVTVAELTENGVNLKIKQ